MKSIYKGMENQYPRTTGMMMLYFMQVDTFRRKTNLMNSGFGQFFVSGWSSLVAWFLTWPLEVLKNMTQAETKGVGNNTRERASYIYRTQGVTGFFRGFIPGGKSVFLRNGMAMVVMQQANKLTTRMGLRD
jgi:hypothetical protein